MLRLENLAKLYGLKVVFKGVSCRFTAGSITLLAGGNGAGKSTLLRIIAGLSRPSAGEVIFDGTGAGGVAREDGPRLAYLGHATFVYPGLSALENLQFWARAHGLRPSRAELLALLVCYGEAWPGWSQGRRRAHKAPLCLLLSALLAAQQELQQLHRICPYRKHCEQHGSQQELAPSVQAVEQPVDKRRK